MKCRWIFAAVLSTALYASAGEVRAPVRPYESDSGLTPDTPIDKLVLEGLEARDIRPARLCSDEVFLRRVYLDVIGTLPTVEETRKFLKEGDPGKREALIDELLEREEFADYWALKWGDLLRIKAEFPINLWPNGVQAYYRWVHTALRDNLPYDRFARELLTASGSNFRAPPVNFWRSAQSKEPEALAGAVALTFLGMRTRNWTEERLSGMAAFFAFVGFKSSLEWKEEIVFHDSIRAEKAFSEGASRTAVFPDGSRVELVPEKDPREVFADWLIRPENPWFARNITNRIWYWLQGRGIIHEPDDIRPDNPPSNEKLLEYLEGELIDSGYDLKHIYRLVLSSKTYQLSSIPATDHPEGEAHFAFYPIRRLDAEVLIDALCQVTGTTEEYSSSIPEPFTFIPEDRRSIALEDGSVTSSFLEMFGRPPRDTGLETERNNDPTPAQRLHLLNSSHIQRKIEQSRKLRALVRNGRDPAQAATDLYLALLSRFPTEEELRIAKEYGQSGPARGLQATVDLAWAIINSPEFLYRH